MKNTTKTIGFYSIFIGISIVLLSTAYSLWQTTQTLKSVKSLQLESAANHAEKAILVPQTLSAITFDKIPDLSIWKDGLQLIITTSEIIQGQTQKTPQLIDLQQNVFEKLPNSIFAKKIINYLVNINKIDLLNYTDIYSILDDTNTILQNLLQGKHTYIITLQNSNELRASGGFMGSYAKILLNDGQIEDIQIHDIYEPDGQFTGYVEAPAGVKEYLSSGNGLRLPDSNWHPDFPTSAQTSLSYFALGNDTSVDGMVAVNLHVMEQIMDVINNIYLPDYNITVSADNLADVARVNRDEFFPGSQQKKHFLSALMKKVMFSLENLTPEQQKEIISIMLKSLQNKDIQLYSNKQPIQKIFEKNNLAGQMMYYQNYPPSRYIYLVESNVGINKANKHIDRKVQIKLKEDSSLLAITFTNTNQPPQKKLQDNSLKDHLGYVNYQRIIVHPNTNVESITFNNQVIEKWNDDIIVNSHGEEFKQIGFILTVPEQNEGVLTIVLDHTNQDVNQIGFPPKLTIQKQPGTPPTQYSISYLDKTLKEILEKDTTFELVY